MIEILESTKGYLKMKLNIRPISTNAFWGKNKSRVYITSNGGAWRSLIRVHLQNLINRKLIIPFEATDVIEGYYFFNFRNKRVLDTANGEKALTDTFEGYLFPNDKKIKCWVLKREEDQGEDYIIAEFIVLDKAENMSVELLRIKRLRLLEQVRLAQEELNYIEQVLKNKNALT